MSKRTGFWPKAGYAPNPLISYMKRNDVCICGSGKKWKKCCINLTARVVTIEEAAEIEKEIKEIKQ
jgi:hypothetical protein